MRPADLRSVHLTSNMIVYQNFEWDFREAATNLAAHGVTFKEASTVFAAENVAITEDAGTDHLYARGSSARGRMLIVQHTRGVRIRILGAMVQRGNAAGASVDVTEQATEVVRTEDVDAASNEHVGAPGIGVEANATGADAVLDVSPVTRPHEAVVRAAREIGAEAAIPGAEACQEIPAPEPPARPRRRIVPHRPRSPEASPQAPESSHVTSATTADVDAVQRGAAKVEAKGILARESAGVPRRQSRPRRVPRDHATALLPGLVDTSPLAETVAPPAPKIEGIPTSKPALEPPRRPGRSRAEAAKSTTQLVLELTRTERDAPEEVARAAPAASRNPGAGMTADEYGIYWTAYAAARDEAKRQGKSLHVAQRLGREAGERAAARGAPPPEPVKPSPKAPAKKVSSWRAAARDMKLVK